MQVTLKQRVRAHLWTAPRWFALPFFGSSCILGSVLAGGSIRGANTWIAFAVAILCMAGGHSFNSVLDYWTGLDKGVAEDRSAEKVYSGGSGIIPGGILRLRSVLINSLCWYALSLIPALYLTLTQGKWPVLLVCFLGMGITFFYAQAKFFWLQEFSLALGVGPLCMLCGMYGVNLHPQWWIGIIASFPVAIILSFGGLALDEWPDAEANIKKGCKSIAYKVWEYKIDLPLYLLCWWVAMYCYQVFLIAIGVLAPMTGITFILFPILLAFTVMLKGNFDNATKGVVLTAALIPVFMVIGQVIGH